MLDDKPRILSRHEHLSAPPAASLRGERSYVWPPSQGMAGATRPLAAELALAVRTTQRHLSFI